MKLIIAEKPSVGIEIARAVGASERGDRFFKGGGFLVSWAAGHLVGLKEPGEYRQEWNWNRDFSFAQLPMLPAPFELKVSDSGQAQFSILKKLMLRTDVTSLVNACDAGREGELIFDYIIRAAGCQKPVERLWTSAALTQEAIKREMQNLRPGSQFDGLRMAARARAAADWLIGINGTRAVTMSQRGDLFTVGRVQTPVLSFLVVREKEICAFVPEAFTAIVATFRTAKAEDFSARYEFAKPNETSQEPLKKAEVFSRTHQIRNSEQVDSVLSALKSKTFSVVSLLESKKTDKPPLLYDLTSLQRDANRMFGFSADKTLKLAQGLYEKHKVFSYPRSDSKCLPQEMRAQLPGAFTALKQAGLPAEFVNTAISRLNERRERVFDDAKVSDHHALIPTAKVPTGLSFEEEKIYRLVALRLLGAFQDDLVTAITDVVVQAKGTEYFFYSKGKVVLQKGWSQVISGANSQSEKSLPNLVKNEVLKVTNHEVKQEMTKPPQRYTEADVLSLMENAGHKLEGENKTVLKGRGIGTPATRAAIIQGLLRRKYIENLGKSLSPTKLGIQLIDVVKFEALKSPQLTAQWELALAGIESGEVKPAEFNSHLKKMVHELTQTARI